MTIFKIGVAEALGPMLSAFHSLTDHSLKGVWQIHTDEPVDRLIFDFGRVSLLVAADENDDSIDLASTSGSDLDGVGMVDKSLSEPWTHYIGKPFGWGWVTVNQQGYCDGLLMSFGGIIPQIALNEIASSIKVSVVG